MSQLFYTVMEVAEQLRVGRTTVYRLISSGDLQSVKIGGSRRVTEGALHAFVRSLPHAQ